MVLQQVKTGRDCERPIRYNPFVVCGRIDTIMIEVVRKKIGGKED